MSEKNSVMNYLTKNLLEDIQEVLLKLDLLRFSWRGLHIEICREDLQNIAPIMPQKKPWRNHHFVPVVISMAFGWDMLNE